MLGLAQKRRKTRLLLPQADGGFFMLNKELESEIVPRRQTLTNEDGIENIDAFWETHLKQAQENPREDKQVIEVPMSEESEMPSDFFALNHEERRDSFEEPMKGEEAVELPNMDAEEFVFEEEQECRPRMLRAKKELPRRVERWGKRKRVPPLAYWENQKMDFVDRGQGSPLLVVKNLSSTQGPQRKAPRKKEIPEEVVGWVELPDGTEEEILLAMPLEKIHPKKQPGYKFMMEAVLSDEDFVSSGVINFPPETEKPTKNSSNHVFVFFVLKGKLSIAINETTFVAIKGMQFIVPRRTTYSIANIGNTMASIFFCTSKDTAGKRTVE